MTFKKTVAFGGMTIKKRQGMTVNSFTVEEYTSTPKESLFKVLEVALPPLPDKLLGILKQAGG